MKPSGDARCRIKSLPDQPQLNVLFHPKRKPDPAKVEALAATLNLSPVVAHEYLRRKKAVTAQRAAVWKFMEATWRFLLYLGMFSFGCWANWNEPWIKVRDHSDRAQRYKSSMSSSNKVHRSSCLW